MGLSASPVPAHVKAGIKAGLLALVDETAAAGSSVRRACRVLELNEGRAARWAKRRAQGQPLDDARPGPAEPAHWLLERERAAILELFDTWGEIDRSHRQLAHRGSRLEKVLVSESTVLRVLQAENLTVAARPPREPVGPRVPPG